MWALVESESSTQRLHFFYITFVVRESTANDLLSEALSSKHFRAQNKYAKKNDNNKVHSKKKKQKKEKQSPSK